MLICLITSLEVDSVYNYILKSLKLNPKTTTYELDTIGFNFYSVLIKSYDKKLKEISKIEDRLKNLGLTKSDSVFSGKLLSHEISEFKAYINKDTLFLNFKIRISPRNVAFDENKIVNYLIPIIENATSVKVDKNHTNKKLEIKSDFYSLKFTVKGEKKLTFSQDDITKIKNALLRDNMYAMDYELGKLVYVKFSGVIEDYVIYDSYIKYLGDSLSAEIKIKKPELKTTKVTSEIIKILRTASRDKVVGYGLNDVAQDLIDNKLVNVVKVDVIMRKDVDLEDIRNKIISEGSKISQNKNAYLVSGVIVVSNPVLNETIYKTIRIEFGNFSDYEMFKIGSISVEVQ